MTNLSFTTCLSAGILSSIGSIAVALLVLLFMITIHEFGHYIIAKIFDFKVNEFAIGMGPALYKKVKKNGEIFSIRLLPLGGFCAFEGEDQENGDPRAFNNKKPWQRILVLLAGATMNFVAAILVFCISIGAYGQLCVQSFEALPSNSAYCLQNDDIILTVNNKNQSSMHMHNKLIEKGICKGTTQKDEYTTKFYFDLDSLNLSNDPEACL